MSYSFENFSIKKLNQKIHSIAIDSRQKPTNKNELFICIIGEIYNGHNFIKEAIKKGWNKFVVSNQDTFSILKKKGFDVILVHNSLRFIQLLAQKHREQFKFPIIAITGSNGKTICKEWIYELLKEDYNIYRSPKSYNSQIGVALSLLELNNSYNLAIIEAGISKYGEMTYLSKMICPTHGLMTNNLNAHIVGFNSMEEKNKEKHLLFQNTSFLIENKNTAIQKHNGIWSDSNVEIIQKENKTNILINEIDFEIPFNTTFEIENTINSILIAIQFTNIEKIKTRITQLNPLSNRWEQFKGKNDTILINDSYTLDIDSLKISIQELLRINNNKKIVLILGLDCNQEYNFKQIQLLFSNKKIDKIILITKKINPNKILKLSLPIEKTTVYNNDEDFLNDQCNYENKLLFFKSSRNLNLQKIINYYSQINHRTQLQIDLEAVKNNLLYFNSIISPKTKKMIMLKASSYGIGSKEMSTFLSEQNVDYFGVAYTDEGIQLRKNNIKQPIIVMNPDEIYFEKGIEFNLEPSVYSLNHLDLIIKKLINNSKTHYPIHIKIDSGMNRLGFRQKEIPHLIQMIKSQPEVKVKSVFSHFSCADNPNFDKFTLKQYNDFLETAMKLEEKLEYKIDKHICNTNASIRFPKFHLDIVRIGIGIHGIGVESKNLKPSIILKSYIAQIKPLLKGKYVGYGNTYQAKQDTNIAIIPIGYADGITRSFGENGGYVMVNQIKCSVIGNVCMDMLMIDIKTHNLKEGDEVEFFGNLIPIEQHSVFQNTIPYEIISKISGRIPRIYIK